MQERTLRKCSNLDRAGDQTGDLVVRLKAEILPTVPTTPFLYAVQLFETYCV